MRLLRWRPRSDFNELRTFMARFPKLSRLIRGAQKACQSWQSQAAKRAETSMDRSVLRLISGVGKKAPACFAIEAQGKRLVLDLGEGPPPGLLPDIAGAAPADALILSHGHKDHIGGLSLLERLGNPPVYATEIVLRSLPDEITARALPIRGRTEVLGIPLETGRDGHAPGGGRLHFGVRHGLLYTCDSSAEC